MLSWRLPQPPRVGTDWTRRTRYFPSAPAQVVQLLIHNQAVLVIDYQVGLAQLVRDYNTNDFRNNMLAHAALGNLFNLPVVMTTSSDTGPNGLMVKEVVDLNPNVTIVQRQGEVNAWDNAEFRAAVKATGKKQLVVGGIVTEVCKFHLSSTSVQRRD